MASSSPKMLCLGVFLLLLGAMVGATPPGIAKEPKRVKCNNTKFKYCNNLEHVCPKFCPDTCTVDCRSCKPICSADSSSSSGSSSSAGATSSSPSPSSPSSSSSSSSDAAAAASASSKPPSSSSSNSTSSAAASSSGGHPPSSPSSSASSSSSSAASSSSGAPPPSSSSSSSSSSAAAASSSGGGPPPSSPSSSSTSSSSTAATSSSGGGPPPSSPSSSSASSSSSSAAAASSGTPSSGTPSSTSNSTKTPSDSSSSSSKSPSSSSASSPSASASSSSSSPGKTPSSSSSSSSPGNSHESASSPSTSSSSASSPTSSSSSSSSSSPETPNSSTSTPSSSSSASSSPTSSSSSASSSPGAPHSSSSSTPSSSSSASSSPSSSSSSSSTHPTPTSGPKKVKCKSKNYNCYGQEHVCPASCPTTCEVDCVTCKPVCRCDYPGAVCQDPRFIGGDGITFYFHGNKDKNFCLITDPTLHINGHFIGKRSPSMTRDFTWVQSVGILYDNHRLYIGAQKTAIWDDSVDRLALTLDNEPIFLEQTEGATFESTTSPKLTITRTSSDTNSIVVEAEGRFKINAKVVPISKKESDVHNYGIMSDDCFAHLDLGFKFYSLGGDVEGVLGKTYRGDYVSKINVGAKMPVLGGEKMYETTGLFSTDCKANRFVEGSNDDAQKGFLSWFGSSAA